MGGGRNHYPIWHGVIWYPSWLPLGKVDGVHQNTTNGGRGQKGKAMGRLLVTP